MLSAALTLDTIADRYGLLPSEVLGRATTLDVAVLDIAMSYHDYKNRLAKGETPNYDQADLQAIMDRHRGARGG